LAHVLDKDSSDFVILQNSGGRVKVTQQLLGIHKQTTTENKKGKDIL
jgi:hypothetical protein